MSLLYNELKLLFVCRNGRLLGVCASVDNCRLFVGGIPKTKKREEILAEMRKVTDGVVDVIVYPSAADKTKNRGFAFVEYESHRAAAMARRKLLPGLYTEKGSWLLCCNTSLHYLVLNKPKQTSFSLCLACQHKHFYLHALASF